MKAEDTDGTTLNAAGRAFIGNLRRALHHLYDPIELRKSPLFLVFGLDPSTGTSALRQILENAIESLKPAATVSTQSDAWRTYRTLYHRFVEQFSQTSVSTNLGLSVRQLRRQERLALLTLAERLIEQYGLNIEMALQGEAETFPVESLYGDLDGGEVHEESEREIGMMQELKWIEQSFPSGQVAVSAVVASTLQTVKPLLSAAGVSHVCDLLDGLPRLQAQWVTVRQILLNILTAAISAVPGGTLHVTAGYRPPHVWVNVAPAAQGPAQSPQGAVRDSENLRIAHELAVLSGGSLELGVESARVPFSARLLLPAVEQLPVLVIDDNADALQLVERYLSNSRYQFVGVRDPAYLQSWVERYQPRAIVLDVMLPSIDGWELLGRLRENPRTAGIPVIICTILPQEELALKLGAAAFLRKPINRERLLLALDQQIDAGATAPC
ncbi:MAG: response regulator [Chloroflexi bacterium]|nr:response regulator [Chloroflexota bacterium]